MYYAWTEAVGLSTTSHATGTTTSVEQGRTDMEKLAGDDTTQLGRAWG